MRTSQTAVHLVDHVIPHVPVRQRVPSLPIPLRLTTLSFAGDGRFTGTMTALTAAVPEPQTYALLLAGLLLAGVARRRAAPHRPPRAA